jgi:hypothetical protein
MEQALSSKGLSGAERVVDRDGDEATSEPDDNTLPEQEADDTDFAEIIGTDLDERPQ